MLKKYSHFWGNLLLLSDIVVTAASWFAAHYLRFNSGSGAPFWNYELFLLPIILVWLFVFRNMGLYRPRRTSSLISEFSDIVKASTLAVTILVAFSFFFIRYDVSRLVFFYFWLISVVSLCLKRAAFRKVLRFIRRKGYNFRRVLIVGGGDLGVRAARKIKNSPWAGFVIVGYLDDYKPIGMLVEEGRVLGRISDVESIVDKNNVDQVLITLPVRAYKRLAYVIEKLRDKLVNISIVPDIYQAITLNAGVADLDGLPLINLTDTPMYGWDVVIKRFLDIFVSLIALIITSPVLIFIALVIKTTSSGPILFKQRRYGLDGKVIWVYKFRTMTVCEDGPDVPQAKKCDPRITPFGVFLRRTSLDELPQFFNVLQGDMSVVGPRPHAIAHNEQYRKLIRRYMLRHKVKPGMTGWAQINGWRGETDTLDKMEKRVSYDLYYIENWSIWLDIKIIWLTLWEGLVSKNAY